MKLIFSINILLFTNKIICLNSRITFHKYHTKFQQSKVKQIKFKPKKKRMSNSKNRSHKFWVYKRSCYRIRSVSWMKSNHRTYNTWSCEIIARSRSAKPSPLPLRVQPLWFFFPPYPFSNTRLSYFDFHYLWGRNPTNGRYMTCSSLILHAK